MSNLTYTLTATPTFNGIVQATVEVNAGQSQAQSALDVIAVHLEPGESATFTLPPDGRGVGVFANQDYILNLGGVDVPIDEFETPFNGYTSGWFLPGLPSSLAVQASLVPVDFLAIGVTGVTVSAAVPAGDKDVLGWTPDASHVAGTGPEYGIFSVTPAAGSVERAIIDQPLVGADLLCIVPPGGNTLDDTASIRLMFATTPGGALTAYGAGLTIPAGGTGLFVVLGDLAGAPIPAGSEVTFEVDDNATVGSLDSWTVTCKLRIP